jgi:predicted RNA-binding protein Jag
MRIESKIEKDYVKEIEKWARTNHVALETIKMNLKGRRGWPDRMVLWEGANVFFIEFKQPDECARRLQEYIHKILRAMGFEVELHDNTDDALESTKAKIRATALADKGHDVGGQGGGVPPIP